MRILWDFFTQTFAWVLALTFAETFTLCIDLDFDLNQATVNGDPLGLLDLDLWLSLSLDLDRGSSGPPWSWPLPWP